MALRLTASTQRRTSGISGDVNGDGFDDITLGRSQRSRGAGESMLCQAGGFSANLNLSLLNGSNGFKINGMTQVTFRHFGQFSRAMSMAMALMTF